MATDCAQGQYCKLNGCAATSGTCTSKPATTTTPAPVCGCDGVTYFNDTLSAAVGMNVRANGACGPQAPGTVHCVNNACQNGQYCSDATNLCATNPVATCWVLPATCSGGDPTLMRYCFGGGNACVSLCTAIRQQKQYEEDTMNCP